MADLQGVRANQLVGHGLIVGLDGSGDRDSDYANQLLGNLARRFLVNINVDDLKLDIKKLNAMSSRRRGKP